MSSAQIDRPDLDAAYGRFGQLERRRFPLVLEEVRDSGAGSGQYTVSGYAAVYDSPSLDLGGFTERIKPGAFDAVLAQNPHVLLTIDHDSRYTLATTKNGTLELRTDPRGLRFWARVAPTSYAQDLRILMDRGDISESSFVFRVDTKGQQWSVGDDGRVYRDIHHVTDLPDVCVTASGAYPSTDSHLLRSRALSYANGLGLVEARKAIPYKQTPLADIGTAWDAGAEVKRADQHDLMAMCAWVDAQAPDEDGDGLPDAKSAYKLPHHRADGQHPCVWRGVAAAMGRLLQAGTQIPDGDRHAVYDHLAKHYADFQKQPPEFRTYGSDLELRSACLIDFEVALDEPADTATSLAAEGVASRPNVGLAALRAKSRSRLLINHIEKADRP